MSRTEDYRSTLAPVPGGDGTVRPIKPGIATPSASEEADTFDLLRLVGILWRGKWLIALLALLATLGGAFYAFEVAQPRYAAETRLILEVRGPNVVNVETVVEGISADQSAFNTEIAVMTSDPLIAQLVDQLDLLEDPEFNPLLAEPSPYSLSEIEGRLRSLLGFEVPEARPPSEEAVLLRTIANVRNAIRVTQERDTYIFRVRVTTGDRSKSIAIANALAQIYIDNQIRNKFSATEFAVNWLSQRVTELELELKEKEDAIRALGSTNELMSEASLEALMLRANELKERVDPLEQSIAQSASQRERLPELLDAGAYAEAASLSGDATLTNLAAEAERGDRGAQAAFRNRVATLVSQAREREAAARNELAAISPNYERVSAQIEREVDARQELTTLTRDADATRVLYETFLARLKETSVQIGLQQADSRILSPAQRASYVAPRKGMLMILAGFFGALLGAGVVLLRQLSQRGFLTVADLERTTGYSVIGQIPRAPIRRRSALIDYFRNRPTSVEAEAIRNLRTSILMSNVDAPPQVIVSCSSVPGEGKTTLAIALAQNLSGLGKRVLLVEADIRRRTFREYFPQKPGGSLIQVVARTAEISEAVVSPPALGADVLMGDKSTINAADLFSSERFRDFIRQAREEYDFVVIDTPPVMVVPDARIIGRLADAIVYAVHWNRTPKDMVVSGLRQLSSVDLRVAGLVLSQIEPKRMKRYGYGNSYTYYSRYYDA